MNILSSQRPRTGAPIQSFYEASDKLESSARTGQSLEGLHPYEPGTPASTVLNDTRECRATADIFNSYEKPSLSIETTGDLVHAATVKAKMTAKVLDESKMLLGQAKQKRLKRYLVLGSIAAVGAAGSALLSPGAGRTALSILGLAGGLGTALTLTPNSQVNQDVRNWTKYSDETRKELLAENEFIQSSDAWHQFLS